MSNAIFFTVSLGPVAALCGNLFSYPLNDRLGRRKSLVLAIIVIICGWGSLAAASEIALLFFGRHGKIHL